MKKLREYVNSNSRRTGRRSKVAMIVGAVLGISSVLLLAFGAFELPYLVELLPERLAQAHETQGSDLSPHGTVIMKTDGERCERMEFDEAGRVVERYRPCGNADLNLDKNGKPLPIGTMRRLDAIGNSFSRQ